MNHPKPEEWVPYVFGETGPEQKRELKNHLQTCAECREQLAVWQRSLGRLNEWKLPRTSQLLGTLRPLLKWAAAIAAFVVIVAVAFSLGWKAAASVSAETTRRQIEPQLRQELRHELAQMLRQGLAENNQAVYAALQKLEAQHLSAYVSLKKDLDTVAVLTDAGLRRTAEQLIQLADFAPPARSEDPPHN